MWRVPRWASQPIRAATTGFVRSCDFQRQRGVDGPLRQRGGKLQVVRAARNQAGAAKAGHDAQLGERVLANMRRRQLRPELEPADGAQLRDVVQHAPTQPCDLVDARFFASHAESLLEMPEV